MSKRRTAAIIVAGGSGRRLGTATPKQYLVLAGEPILLRAIRPFLGHPGIEEVILVLPEADADRPPEWLESLPTTIVAGGAERGDSVWNGLQHLSSDIETVLIHDGARPFVSREIIDRVIEAAAKGASITAVPVTDTIKVADSDGLVTGTLDRNHLWRAQTPQGFPAELIRQAYTSARNKGIRATDDAALCEQLAIPVRLVEGSPQNMKITDATDLTIAEAIASREHAGKSGD